MRTTTTTDTWLHRAVQPHASVLQPTQVPRRYQSCTLAGIRQPSLRAAVEEYGAAFWDAAPRGLGTMFVGVAGTYKTYATAVLAQAIREHFLLEVTWANCAEEFEQLDRTKFSAEANRRLQELKGAPLVVLDDVAQVTLTSTQFPLLLAVVNARYDSGLPTYFTANLDVGPHDKTALARALGANLNRRVLEMTEGYRIAVQAKAG